MSHPPGTFLRIHGQQAIAISTDTLLRGRHYRDDVAPGDLGHKCLAVSLSDMAAMGAKPLACRLTAFQATDDPAWRKRFMSGFTQLAERFTTTIQEVEWQRGEEAFCVEIYGEVPAAEALTRGGARVGDAVFVSGTPGDAALVYRHFNASDIQSETTIRAVSARLDRPEPRVKLGLRLRSIASSAIDLSDGLAQDLGHILQQSRCGAELWLDRLPLSEPLLAAVGPRQARQLAISGGDDYELCFTAAPRHRGVLQVIANELKLIITEIGIIRADPGLRPTGTDAARLIALSGHDHFKALPERD